MKIRIAGAIVAALSFAVLGWVAHIEHSENVRERRRLQALARMRIAEEPWERTATWAWPEERES